MQEANPQEVAALWMAATRRGDWSEAWRQTDRIELPRRKRQAAGKFQRGPQHLVWDGTPFDGRDVLVRCEHGLGDTLQFIRFVPHVHARARSVVVRAQPHLLPLLRGAPGLGDVRNAWTEEPPPPHDLEIEVMELAYAFRCTVDTVPPPYPGLASQLAGRPPLTGASDGRLKVGLLWSASGWDSTRSLPLPSLQPLLDAPHLRLYSLQQDDDAGVAQLARAGVEPLSRRTAGIADAAAAILELDLVITVDAMLAHLGGTLGRATWVILKHEADWRWMDGRTDSPWYPQMRLFRQPRPGDWDAVVASIVHALRERSR